MVSKSACSYCKRSDGTHTDGCKKVNPAACQVCARFAPEKCKRHGGPARSTSFSGKKRKGGAPVVSKNGHGALSVLGQIDAAIQRKRTEIEQLEAAKAVLAGITL